MIKEIPNELKSFVKQGFATGHYAYRKERQQALAGVREGLADLATDRVQSLADAFNDFRHDSDLADAKYSWRKYG